MDSLKKKYAVFPEISRIARHRHLPMVIKKMKDKEENKKKKNDGWGDDDDLFKEEKKEKKKEKTEEKKEGRGQIRSHPLELASGYQLLLSG